MTVIAVLICDEPSPEQSKTHGNYHEMFKRLVSSSLNNETDLIPFDARTCNFPSLSDYQCIIITGSKASAYDDTPWIKNLISFISTAFKTSSIKICGICFGHQIIAMALGGLVTRNPLNVWEAGPYQIACSSIFKPTLIINQMHRDVVVKVPDDFQVYATSKFCENQGMEFGNRVITIQGHPEFANDYVKELLLVRRGVVISEDCVDEALDALNSCQSNDGVEWMQNAFKYLEIS